MTGRRAFIVGAGASLVAGGFLHASGVAAQQAGNTYRIGVLAAGTTEPLNWRSSPRVCVRSGTSKVRT